VSYVEAKFRVQCPACKGFYKCSIQSALGQQNPDGSYMFSLRMPHCHHVLLVYLDANLNPRNVQVLLDPKVSVEFIRTDRDNLLLKEKELLDLHAAAIISKDQARTEETWQELKRIRREIMQAGLD
jgi:hypothetical protein